MAVEEAWWQKHRIEAVVVIAPLGALSRRENVSLAFVGKMDKFPPKQLEGASYKTTMWPKNRLSDLSCLF